MTNDEVVRMIMMSEAEKLRIITSYREMCDCTSINTEYRDLYADMWCVVADDYQI